ncbi:MAG: hypothetical protein LCH66_12590 [Actinobacteria bacterium]|jgi:Polyketide cyclase / dehydrase and lipid transport.|nr:hypothetical protein [Actinomycetota bacterium]
MTVFSASRRAEAIVNADQGPLWALLADPKVLTRHTPFVTAIEDLGNDRWSWSLAGISYPGGHFGATFVEKMTFTPESRIDFAPDPHAGRQRAGATGTYRLKPHESGTHLLIDLTVTADLPAPRGARHLIEPAMRAVIALMWDAFAKGLISELTPN